MMHALLSPSSASRWLTCTPSAHLETHFEETTSKYADEGTLAHALGEILIMRKRGVMTEKDFRRHYEKIKKSEYFEQSMYDHMQDYSVYVMEKFIGAGPHALMYQEKKLDLTAYIPEGFGTGDVGIIGGTELTVIDLKYGKGVHVHAEENKQMMCYALGWLDNFDAFFDFETVRMIIYQPRVENGVTEYVLPVSELKAWAEDTLKPKAKMAWHGEGEFVAGDHCKFCRAKPTCRAFAEMNLKVAQLEFVEPELLNDFEVVDILQKAKGFQAWLKSMTGYALQQAVKKGKVWPGMKLVEGRSNRIFTDEKAATLALRLFGNYKDEEILTLRGIGELEKLMGVKTFAKELKEYITKPAGSPTLVDISDKREPLNSLTQAQMQFTDDEFTD